MTGFRFVTGIGHVQNRQSYSETGYPLWRAADIQLAAMPVDDMFDDRQPQPGAANLPGSCLVNAIETFGQAVNVFFGDWFATVANSDTNMPALNGADSYGDVRLRKAIFDRIVELNSNRVVDRSLDFAS